MEQSPIHRHFQEQQSTLMTVVIGIGFYALAAQLTGISGAAQWGLVVASIAFLVHWHYGATYVLFHLGPTSDPLRGLWDGGIVVAVIAVPTLLAHPTAWFAVSGASYAFAWAKYARALREARHAPPVRVYMRNKSRVEVAAFSLSWLGAVTQWLVPQGAPLYAWGAALINGLFIWAMTRRLGFYRDGWNAAEWDLDQPTLPRD